MNIKLRDMMALVAVTLALVWCIPSVGQVLKGSISGTVVDPQNAVVSGAQVKATHLETGSVSTTTSDSSGLFRLNLLQIGTYSITITAQGFKTLENKNVAVKAGDDSGLGTMRLTIGEASSTLEVVGAAPLVDTTEAQVTNTFSGTTLQTFAGVQENEGLDRLALFVPGIASSRSNNFSNTNGASISSNGLRGRNNDQEIDGQNNNDNSVGGPGLFVSDTEFVQQYVIVTNQFGAEYGRNSGSVVNIITKQGTNNWHGSLYGTENNSFLNALSNTQRNTLKPGSITPQTPAGVGFTGPPRSNDEFGGGTIGGPILKNKVFIFGGFDQEISEANSVYTTSSLTPTPLGLSQLAGCAGLNANSLSVLQNFGPYAFSAGNPTARPTGPGGTFTTTTIKNANGVALTGTGPGGQCVIQVGGVTRVLSTPQHAFNWVMRSDVQLSSNDSLSARYLFNRDNFFNLSDNGAAGWVFNEPALSQSVLFSETHNFSSRMVNEARVSFSRLNVEFGGGLNPGEPVSGNLSQAFTNISMSGGFLGMGPATNLPQARLVNTWQAQDNWNWVLGKHAIKAGVNFTYQRSPNTFLPDLNGQFGFTTKTCTVATTPCPAANKVNVSSLSQFLASNSPSTVTIANGQPVLDFREYDTFLYFGDDWKISQNLTLNLGLTWTYYGNPENLFNTLSTKQQQGSSPFWNPALPLSVTTDPTIPSIFNSFGPSVGFAYSPQWGGFLTGHGKTTFRGGYRLLYDPPFYNIFLNVSTSSPFVFLQSFTNAIGLPTGTFGLATQPNGPTVRNQLSSTTTPGVFDPRTAAETTVSNNFGPDKAHTWSFGLERELTKNSALEARYAGNHATNLYQTIDGNPYLGTAAKPGLLQTFPQFIPNASSFTPCAATQQVGAGAGSDVGRVNCGPGVTRTRNNGAFSDYNALQVEFRANNMFKQLTMRTGYTWSKTLDNVSEIFATGTAGNTLFASQNPFNTGSAERSISGLNYPGVFSILFTEQLPFFREQHGAIGHLLGGWAISADYLLASGQPYTPRQAFREALLTGAANYYDSSFVNAFVGVDVARPFFGSLSAPSNTVGVFAHDACAAANLTCSNANAAALTALSATQLVSLNALNNGNVVTVTNNDVRFIMNTGTAQTVFGTPFGNVPRNSLRDAISNIANVSVFKNIKLGERVNFEMHATALNALNHFNFSSVDSTLEDAGLANFGQGFANPSLTTAGGRTFFVGGKITF
ncbi:MAG TPA: TonB-dependent receptor [Candidatus Angelobacter sp.]|nr:TonB-dependent receptor [Candidatus Angelobacter sp.]